MRARFIGRVGWWEGELCAPWSFQRHRNVIEQTQCSSVITQESPPWAMQMHGRGWCRRNTVGAIGEQKGRPWPKAEIRSSSETSGFQSSPHSVSRGATKVHAIFFTPAVLEWFVGCIALPADAAGSASVLDNVPLLLSMRPRLQMLLETSWQAARSMRVMVRAIRSSPWGAGKTPKPADRGLV